MYNAAVSTIESSYIYVSDVELWDWSYNMFRYNDEGNVFGRKGEKQKHRCVSIFINRGKMPWSVAVWAVLICSRLSLRHLVLSVQLTQTRPFLGKYFYAQHMYLGRWNMINMNLRFVLTSLLFEHNNNPWAHWAVGRIRYFGGRRSQLSNGHYIHSARAHSALTCPFNHSSCGVSTMWFASLLSYIFQIWPWDGWRLATNGWERKRCSSSVSVRLSRY
jgi:hypothetical protein